MEEKHDRILNREQVAKVFDLSVSTIDKWLKLRFIPSSIIKGRRVFSERRIWEWMTEEKSKREIQDDAFLRQLRELELRRVLLDQVELGRRQADLLQKSADGEEVSSEEFAKIQDRLATLGEQECKLQREMNQDAGLGWVDEEKDAKKKAVEDEKQRRKGQVEIQGFFASYGNNEQK